MESHVLILAPHGRDAQVVESLLRAHDLEGLVCPDGASLLSALEQGAGTAVLTEEVLAGGLAVALAEFLGGQPPWSDFPFVVLATRTSSRRSTTAAASLRDLGNLVLLERPVNPETLVSAVRSALRGRARQYASRVSPTRR